MEEWKHSARRYASQSRSADERCLLTPRETAKRLAVSERHLHTLTRSGHLPCVRVGTCVRYNLETIQKWVREAESTEPSNIKTDSSTRTSAAPATKPRTRLQPEPKLAASKKRRSSTGGRLSVPGRESLKELQPAPKGKPQEVQGEERTSPFSGLLEELGVNRGGLPPITNGELMRIAEVDIATMHGWLYLNRPLPEDAMNRLKEHFRSLCTRPQASE